MSTSVIEQLLEDMITECSACQGSGIRQYYIWKSDEYDERQCDNCEGEGKEISWEGRQLIQIINTGEIP